MQAVWPHAGVGDVPQDVAVLVRVEIPRKDVLGVWFLDSASKTRVAAELVATDNKGLFTVRPATTLVPGRAHEVWASVQGEGTSAWGRESTATPGAREVHVVTVNPVVKAAGKATPRLKKPHVRFSAWQPGDGNRARIRSEGRDAELRFPKGSSGAAVVRIQGRYDPGGEAEPIQWDATLPFSESLDISTTRGLRCRGYDAPRPPAPRAGRYELRLTPWSASGVPGRPVILKGRIPR